MGNTDSAPGLSNLQVDRDVCQVYNDWTMAQGDLEGLPVTVFSASHPVASKKRPYIERALQASRVYRHPGLLRYCGGGVVGGEVVMVMEAATPLQSCHQEMSALQVTAGLASIVKTVCFLHDTAGVSHNNLSTSSIFVTPDDAWKLWGLEYSCGFSDLSDRHLTQIQSYCHKAAVPPDDTARIGPAYQHARDVYSFASLVDDLLTRYPAIGDVPGCAEFILWLRSEGQQSDWVKRPRFDALRQHPLFQHQFLLLHHNLTTLLIMDDTQRDLFLSGVVVSLRQYPETVVACSLSAALLSRPVLLVPKAAQAILPSMLTPSGVDGSVEGLFSPAVYEEHIVPHIRELYSLHDLPIRELLLDCLQSYHHLIPKDVLKKELLPEILLGIQDSSESLVCCTLRALAVLVPVLGADCVVGRRRRAIFGATLPKVAAAPYSARPISQRTASPKPRRSQEDRDKLGWSEVLAVDGASALAERSSPDGGEDDLSDVPTSEGSDCEAAPLPPTAPGRAGKRESEEKQQPTTEKCPPIPKDSPKNVSYKLDRVGFNEIFGGVRSAVEEGSTAPPQEHDASEQDPASETSAKNIRTNNSSDEGADWSDWEDVNQTHSKGDINFSAALNALNNNSSNSRESNFLSENTSNRNENYDKTVVTGDSNSNFTTNTEAPKERRPTSPYDSNSQDRSHCEQTPKPTKAITTQEYASQWAGSRNVDTKKALGEEYDILSIEVKKIPDKELDFFADLAPNLKHKKFDLESLLQEATVKVSRDLPASSVPEYITSKGRDSSALRCHDSLDHRKKGRGDDQCSTAGHSSTAAPEAGSSKVPSAAEAMALLALDEAPCWGHDTDAGWTVELQLVGDTELGGENTTDCSTQSSQVAAVAEKIDHAGVDDT